MATSKKTYLGDKVYAYWQNNVLILITDNGVNVSNRIFLEPETLDALMMFTENAPVFEPTSQGDL